ncbi:MAG: ABC transporter permease [Nanoarchaeota archaeon]
MIKDYFFLSFGNLRHRGLRSWLTVLGIFIGIAAVVSLISMGAGLKTAITGQFGALSVDRLTVQNKQASFGPPGSTVVEKLNKHDLDIIKNVNGVDIAVPRLIRVTEIEYNKISRFNYISDIPEDKESLDFVLSSLNLEIEKGRFLQVGDSEKVVLGNDFLETDNFEKKLEVGKTIKINGKDFEIVGFLKKSSSFEFNGVILVMSDDLKDTLNIVDEYDMIVLQVSDKDIIEEVASEIERKLRDDRNEKVGEESFSVETPLQALSTVNTILNIINLIVIGIAAISLFVGGVGIANTMYTSVIERTREIGVMKAIGARNSDVLSIFLIESGLLGLVGGIIGVLLGIGIGKIIEYIAINNLGTNLLKVVFPWYLIAGCLVFAFIVGVLSGFFPARQAGKINVVDALRYE